MNDAELLRLNRLLATHGKYGRSQCCVDCGGALVGDGYRSPIHCESIEPPDGVCPDEGPFYCSIVKRIGAQFSDFVDRVMFDKLTAPHVFDELLPKYMKFPLNIKPIMGCYNLSIGRTPMDYYYQTKFGPFSKDKHPRGDKFKRAVGAYVNGKWVDNKWVNRHEPNETQKTTQI